MRRLSTLLVPLLLGLTACGGAVTSPQGQDAEVQLFAAASLGAVGDELIAAYRQENPQVSITATYAGSSQLVTQMVEGATPDLLITADSTTMNQALEKVEDLAAATPETIATNALVLATAPGNPAAIDSLDDLAAPGVLTAICAEQVPCGHLAHQELTRQGVEPATSTEEANVSAVSTKVATGQVDAGFIYSTDATAISATDNITVITLPQVERNAYPLALTGSGQGKESTQNFANWLMASDVAAQILADYGFEPA
ncbi:MAG: molybdate ABC transporter substrate-binding protein [Rothia sp. (in: high G+C Gram-positive bacteria)]|uniref:molybdate ABC transporter substrate-binding protein n=1 Tax=Rothia sp. (in: high G+C Gram-positive bacteria) TaxID=1885016 RepID=UPI0026F96031|nr:molybdate ABC transporter substrate-binding protein [Rothia sp. (in: high G+C Gram-positive bacteria)]